MSILREHRGLRIIARAALAIGLCLLALGTAGCPSKKGKAGKSGPPPPLYFEDAAEVAKIFGAKLGGGGSICRLNIHPRHAIVDVQKGANETEAFKVVQTRGSLEPSSIKTCVVGPTRTLADAVFPWSDVDLTVVPAIATQAQKKLGLKAIAEISHMLLERPPELVGQKPEPKWKVFSKASAWVTFDLKGKLTGGQDGKGGSLAGAGLPDYFKDANPIRALIEAKLGKSFELAQLQIFQDRVLFEGKPPDKDTKLQRYWIRGGDLVGPEDAAMDFRDNLADNMIPLDGLDWSLPPQLAKDAVLRSGQAGVTPSRMQVEQGMFYKPLTWMVYLNETKRFYVYDKTGKLLHEKN